MEVNALGKTCAACGTPRKAKLLAYDPNTFLPYCSNAYACGHEDHPNSVKNMVMRQTSEPVELLQFEDAERLFQEHLLSKYANPEEMLKIKKLIDKPIVFRLGNPDLAEFLVKLERDLHLESMSDTVRYCIQMMLENHKFSTSQLSVARKEQQEERKLEAAAQFVSQPDPQPVTTPQQPTGEWDF